MITSRRALLLVMAAVSATALACGEPPDKEVQQAQGAIDAARAAGAEQYARDEFTAATEALQRAHDATQARDYRLALNHALDSRERANNAAREAADNKATARVEADRAISSAGDALQAVERQLAGTETRRPPVKVPPVHRDAVAAADKQLQEARLAFSRGDFRAATAAATAAAQGLTDTERALGALAAPAPRRSR